MMKNIDKSEDLLIQFRELKQKYRDLEILYNKSTNRLNQTEELSLSDNSNLELGLHAAKMARWELNLTTGEVIFGKRKA